MAGDVRLGTRDVGRRRGGAGFRVSLVITIALLASVVATATAAADSSPVIVSNPTDQTVTEGASATFDASATGDPDPTVQWERSDDVGATYAPIPGATSPVLTFVTTAADHGAKFRATFTNSAGSTTTNNSTLVVWKLPDVIEQPVDATAALGETVTFTSEATSNAEPTVQWQRSINGGASWTDVAGATFNALNVGPLTAGHNGNRYRAVFTNVAGSTTSTPAIVTVGAAPPTVTQNPANTTVGSGGTATFTAAATGLPMPQLQWERASATGAFVVISGATAATYTTPPTIATDTGSRYRLRAANLHGIRYSAEAVLTVEAAPVITSNPSSRTVAPGAPVSFVVAGAGTPAPTVQWQRSTDAGATWIDVSGATGGSYSFTAAPADNGVRLRAVLTNAFGSATSSFATLIVGIVPSFPVPPTDASVGAGDPATFSVAVFGSPAPTLQWQSSTDGGTTWINVGGATTTSLTVTTTAASDGVRYRVLATNALGTVPSATARITLLTAPAITAQPQDTAVAPGSPASFTIVHSGGTAPVTVKWQRRALNTSTWSDIAGATSDTFVYTPPLADLGTSFRAVLSSPGGNVSSEAATLDVVSAPVISVHPASWSGGAAGPTLTFSAAGWTAGYWERSFDEGATWSTYAPFTPPATGSTNGGINSLNGDRSQFRVVLTNPHGSTTSSIATVRYNAVPVVQMAPVGHEVVPNGSNFGIIAPIGSSVTLLADVVGGYPAEITSITWTRCTTAFQQCTTLPTTGPVLSFTVTGADSGRWFRANATNATGTGNSGFLQIIQPSPIQFTLQPVSVAVAEGGTATFTTESTISSLVSRGWETSADGGLTWAPVPEGPVSFDPVRTLTLTDVQVTANGDLYRYRVTTTTGTAYSDTATLTVLPAPSITVVPGGNVLEGADVPLEFSCGPEWIIATCVAGVVDGDAPDPIPVGYTPPNAITSGDPLDTTTTGRRTVVVRAVNALGVTAFATSVFDVVAGGVNATVPDGGNLNTGGTPSSGDPLTTSVTVPVGGFVRILEGATTGSAPAGYSWFGLQTEVTAPIHTAATPATIVLQAHGSLLAGTPAASVLAWRNGVAVPNCVGGANATAANPNPCVKQRLPLTNGGVKFTILSTSGGIVNLGKATASPPSAPLTVDVTPGVRSLVVAWQPPASDGGAPIGSYVVTVTPTSPAGSARSVTVTAPTTTATISSLGNGAGYSVTVKARNAVSATYGPLSPATPATTLGLPSAPTDVAASPGPSSLDVVWTAGPSDAAITKYTVTATATRPDLSTHTVSKSVTGAPPATATTLTGLTVGLTYEVTVTATSAVGTSAPSAPSTPTAPAISISIGNRTATEGNAPIKGFIFTVTLSATPAAEVTVDVTTAHGTTDADDLNELGTTLVFAPGQKSTTIVVYVKGDTTPEPTDTFHVDLTNPTGAQIKVGRGLGTITNDD